MKGITQKLWASMMFLVVVMLVLLWFAQIVFLEDFYTAQRVGDIKNKARVLIQGIGELGDEGLHDALNRFAYDYNCGVELLDQRGNSLYSGGPDTPMGGRNYRRGSFLQEVMSGKDIALPMTHPRFGSNYMVIGMPIEQGYKTEGVLIINMPLAPVHDTTAILKKQLVYISVVLLVVALGLSFQLSRSFIRPILEIKAATGRMASGDFGVKLKTGGTDEIGDLSRAVNHLGEELSKTEKLRRDLIANVSHELRTPLSLIRGYAETIRDISGDNKDKRNRQLGVIVEETERLGNIVNDILDLSRMQSGNITLEKEPFDLVATLHSIIKRYDLLSEKTGVQMVLIGTPEGGTAAASLMVRGDRLRIKQVLLNLIDNAFNYSTSGGIIRVGVGLNGTSVRVEVSDTGKGIPQKELANIWDRFYKGGESRDRRALGTGLGLAIVKNILEAHRAEFGVESVLGKGTTFWFEMPV